MTEHHHLPSELDVPSEAPDRNLALELVRVTEAAAMAAGRWVGRGDKNGADGAAVRAMRTLVSTVSMNGVVVIGEGEKDEAPMLFNGERVGDGTGPECDIAVDPIDGTTLTAKGMTNAIAVLAAQSRMVWQIARIYNQRPTARELAVLYINVAMAALLSRQLEELDASEMLQPLLSAIMPSTLSAVPGMQTASIIFTQAVLSGSANAYGTLRVGVIAKRYCGSLTMPEPSTLRKAAFAEAMLMIPSVVQQGAETVFDLLKRAAAKTLVDSTQKATAAVVDTVSRGVEQFKQGVQQVASSSAEKVRGLKIRWPFRRDASARGDQNPPAS